MMTRSMEVGKRFFGEKVFNTIMGYLKKNPEENLEKALDMIEKVAVAPNHKEYARLIREQLDNNPALREYINRVINELDENVHDHLINNFFVNASLVGVPQQHKEAEKLGVSVPYTVLIDPTSACNLRCKGCWAGAYERHHSLSFEEVDRIVSEAKDLGMYFIAMSGGEPMMWKHLPELCRKHYDVAFMIYTNGTLIDENAAEWMREAGNITPAISLEGDREVTDQRRGEGVYDKIMAGMDHLKDKGVAFGFSMTITRENAEKVYSDEFIDFLIEKGALYGWSFHYIPIGDNPDLSLMVTPEQRASLVDRVRKIRTTKPIQVADFWNDGELTKGCIAGGRRYFHINANGDVEPCAFVHFAADTIKGKSLKEVLQNPLFKAYQRRHPFDHNLLRPCPLIDRPEQLREMVEEADAVPTHEGADTILQHHMSREMDAVAQAWGQKAEEKWAEINREKEKVNI